MSLDTAIRLSAEVKGANNITKVQRSLQDLAQGSKTTARDMQTLRAATFQYARANDGTIAGIRNSITAFRGLQEQAKIGGREFQRYGSEIQKLEAKLRGIDGTAEKAGRSMGQNLAAGLAAGLAAMGAGQAVRGSIEAVVASEESQRRLRSLSQGLDDYSRVQATATAAAQKFGVAQTQANQEFAQIYARLRPVGLTLEEISTVYNGFNTAAKLSGASSAEASAAFLQLSQALGTGVLRGEELNSVFEQTPAVVQGIAQVMGVPIGQIRDLAKEGKISGDIVLEALKRIERDGAPKLAEAMKGPAQQFKNLQNESINLQEQLGKALLPTAIALTKAATALLQESNKLPGPIKAIGSAAAVAGIATLGLVAAAAALKAGLAALGITAAITALKGLTVAAFAAKIQMIALNAVAMINPWVALAAGIGAATYALATYRSESEKIGGKAATGDAAGMTQARQRITAKQQEIATLERQRPGPRSSRGGDLARARVELAQLQRDVQTGQRAAAGGGSTPSVPNAMGTPIGATVGGGGGGSKGDADSLAKKAAKAREDAAEKMREQKEASDELLVSERNRLEILQESDPMQRTVIESMIKELEIQSEYEKKLKEARSVREKENLQLAQQYAIRSNTLELERELSDLTKDAQKPLQDALTEAGNRLAYEREYGELLSKGINPELAKQFVELDRIATAAKTNLELQIAMLEARAAELPIASEIRKELERQIELRKEQLKLIPGTVAETKGIMTATGDKAKRTPEQDITAKIKTLKDEIKDLTSIGQVAITSADNIGNAFGSAFQGLISGAMSAREALAGFFKDVAAGFIEMAAQIIAKQMTMIVLQTILKALGAAAGSFSGGTSSAVDTSAGGWANSFNTPLQGIGNIGPIGFAGGGYTGNAPRAGGVDGQGGFPAILHPQETVIDHTRAMAVPYQRSAAAATTPAMEVPYQRSGPAMAVPFQKAAGSQAGGGMSMAIDNEPIRFESIVINSVEYVSRAEAEEIGRRSEQRTFKKLQNSPSARRAVGMG
jgi:tape measure domain-containing protein